MLTDDERHQACCIAAEFKKDLVQLVHCTFAAADELKIDPHVVSAAITTEALALAAFLHAGSDESFFRMVREIFATASTAEAMQ
jgi:hypothetical protein